VSNSIYILSPAIGVAGGADKATKLLAEAYSDLGYRVSVFATSYEVKSNQEKIKIYPPVLNYGHRWKLPHISLFFRLLYNCIVRKPKFIHCVGLTFEVKQALSFLKRYKIVVWETTEANKGNRFVYPGIVSKLKYATLMLAPSETIKKNILKNYDFNGSIAILPFWTEWQISQNKEKDRSGRLLYVGRLDKDKGFDCLFNALRKIKQQVDFRLDICGRGNVELIKQLADGLTNVNFHGFVDDIKMTELYNLADFIVLPSKHEGYPLSLIEACGKSIPIIASRVGSIPEVYANSQAGLLFNANNADELGKCLLTAYDESQETYQFRRAAARRLYEQINDISKVQMKLQEIIKQIDENSFYLAN